ncbi:hypothetical protein F4779DRAFT_585324 [Xylariaceae sp. FL0662B]|nr:hypothetical protein F4779DRAFT_585324 [Xylariaceae sp. FL0662B]
MACYDPSSTYNTLTGLFVCCCTFFPVSRNWVVLWCVGVLSAFFFYICSIQYEIIKIVGEDHLQR